ncbi:MAG: hypothetical protein LBH12_07170, partial [Dysgonamonadaceae bacterium]|nr:hypothetical protein [Dysgonamonadaceae bacterium]
YTCEPTYYEADATKYVDIKVDEDGAGPLVGKTTLRFLTYNLGANPNMTVKEQMGYTSGGADDITVFGGLYQWGRKDPEHSLRCSKDDVPGSFRNTQYTSAADATAGGQFVYGSSNWLSSAVGELWGNGKAINSGGNDSPVKNTDYDPCPSGYRVPTQYEWALLGHKENGPDNPGLNLFTTPNDAAGTIPSSGIVWVRVSGGKAATSNASWSADGEVRGYALYDSTVWSNADPDYKDGTNALTDPAAPEPLLFLPAGGRRNYSDGSVDRTGSLGYYWSSVVGFTDSYYMYFFSSGVAAHSPYERAYGMSVRCISVN